MPLTRSDTLSNQTISGLLHHLLDQLTTLLRQELTLARIEVSNALPRLCLSLSILFGGIAVIYAGFLLLLCAALLGLSLLMPVWLAALSLGLVVIAAGWGLLQKGKKLFQPAHLAPSRIRNSLQLDKDAMVKGISR